MEDSKKLDHQEDFPDKTANKEAVEIKNNKQISISISNKGLDENKDLEIKPTQDGIKIENNKEILDVNNNVESITELNTNKKKEKTAEDINLTVVKENLDKSAEIIDKDNNESSKNKKLENNKIVVNSKLDSSIDKSANNLVKEKKEIGKEKQPDNNKKVDLNAKSNIEIDKTKNNPKQIASTVPVKAKTKPLKEPPIEKKPFLEFINDYLIPEIKNEFKLKGKEINKINLQKTNRPIAEDICWVIYCEIKDTCNFWLSFEKDDITSLKSFSLCKNYEKPSIIESFLIDEKKITLKLIISRILQRLNGQKLIGAN